MNSFDLYLITRLDTIKELYLALAIISGIIIFVLILLGFRQAVVENDKFEEAKWKEYWKNSKKRLRLLILFFSIGILADTLTPTTTEAVVIYLVPKLVNNEKIRELPNNALDLVNEWMKKQVQDLKK
jgi:TRAP-type C4-dicarboxylate transport system permease large subunit